MTLLAPSRDLILHNPQRAVEKLSAFDELAAQMQER
jgi:hypothetical protein